MCWLKLWVGRARLDVVVSKGVWNCGEEWVNKTFSVYTMEKVVPKS